MGKHSNRNSPAPADEQPLANIAAPSRIGRIFTGHRENGQCVVYVEEQGRNDSDPRPYALPLRLDLRNHSPAGFEWGYGGSGPAQLALALLIEALGDAELAQAHYQDFKFAVVARWGDSWRITSAEIREFINQRGR